MSETILVTGVAGFIGSHLAEALIARGYNVRGIDCFTDYYDVRIKKDNISSLLNNKGFTFVGDSLSRTNLDALVDGVTSVFHLAAQAGVRASWGERFDEYIDSNIRSTQRLCEALKNTNIRKLVYASSSSVYGETSALPMSESHPVRPVSPYGVTKLDGENLCLLYARNYGLSVACLRFFTVFGPRQRPDMAIHRFIRGALRGEALEVYGNGEQTRDFTFVDDIVDANIAAMSYTGEKMIFNIGGGSRVSLNRVLDVIGAVTGVSLDVRYREVQRGDVTHTFADIERAATELGYSPHATLEEGVAREVDWVRRIISNVAPGADA